MKKGLSLFIVIVLLLSLCSCGGNKLPDDWVILSYDEAISLYHSVDFNMENINDYLEFQHETYEGYNDWDELTYKTFTNGVKFRGKNPIKFDSSENEFIIDISYTMQRRYVQLDPKNLKEIKEDKERTSIYTDKTTCTDLNLNGFLCSGSFTINYNPDGTPILDDNGELWVVKEEIIDYKVERVKGHAEWLADIPDEYFMTPNNYTIHKHMSNDSTLRFIVVEGEKNYYCYEDYGIAGSYQTTTFNKKGDWQGVVGSPVNFTDK